MKIRSILQQQNLNFRGGLMESAADLMVKHPKLPMALTGLAGSSVIAQKIVMSGSEATIGPAMDIAIGKTITKITDEKDDRTNQSSRVQAVRTFAQSVGGTITGVIIRGICILGSTLLLAKLGSKAGSKIGEMVAGGLDATKDAYKFQQRAADWGKNLGGAIAVAVMMVTNFIIDAPFINWINKKSTELIDNFKNGKNDKTNEKEVK